MNIVWSRKYYWEGDEVTLSTHNSSGHSTCPTVWNYNKGDFTGAASPNNWLQIDASAINSGEIPSPPIIEIENDSSISWDEPRVHMFYNRLSSPTTLPHIIQGETQGVNAYKGGNDGCGDSHGTEHSASDVLEEEENDQYCHNRPQQEMKLDLVNRFFNEDRVV